MAQVRIANVARRLDLLHAVARVEVIGHDVGRASGAVKLGQPVPLSNLLVESNSGVSQQMQW